MKLHYAGQVGGPFGWGVCGQNLTSALSAHFEITGPEVADVVFMPLADHNFNPATAARARINVAYTFFESALGKDVTTNAARYHRVFAGSSWCLNRMKQTGISNGHLLIQGVDYNVFKPGTRHDDGRIRVFSGGKFEYRKGQDLVIAGFKEFLKLHPNAVLVCAWFNPWPQLFGSMRQSKLLLDGVRGANQKEFFENLLLKNGLKPEQFQVLPQLGQQALVHEMQNTDFGVFPNRCEGGTNLVLMEYLACGKRAAANLQTGHTDLAGAHITEIPSQIDAAGWALQQVSDIASSMDTCLNTQPKGSNPTWHWQTAAQIVADQIRAFPASSIVSL